MGGVLSEASEPDSAHADSPLFDICSKVVPAPEQARLTATQETTQESTSSQRSPVSATKAPPSLSLLSCPVPEAREDSTTCSSAGSPRETLTSSTCSSKEASPWKAHQNSPTNDSVYYPVPTLPFQHEASGALLAPSTLQHCSETEADLRAEGSQLFANADKAAALADVAALQHKLQHNAASLAALQLDLLLASLQDNANKLAWLREDIAVLESHWEASDEHAAGLQAQL